LPSECSKCLKGDFDLLSFVKHYRPFYDSFLFKEPRKSSIPLFKFYFNQTSQEQERREREELDRMLEENRRKVVEAQRKEALEQQQKELERYLELERIQKQREEALRRKKMEEEEERANELRLLGKSRR